MSFEESSFTSGSYSYSTAEEGSTSTVSFRKDTSSPSLSGADVSESEYGYRSQSGELSDASSIDFGTRVSDCSNSGEESECASTEVDDTASVSSDQSGQETEKVESSSGSFVTGSGSNLTLLSDHCSEAPKDTLFLQTKKGEQKHSPSAPSVEQPASIIHAAKTGDGLLLNKLLAKGCNLMATDSNRRTALHVACSLGRLEMVCHLIAAGSNIDACSTFGQTPLHEACVGGHVQVVEALLSEVSDLDAVDSNGCSAFHYCASNGEAVCLELLCDHGCDICLEDELGRSGVHLAAMKNHANVVQCLMERGMELDAGDAEGKTPAHYTCRYGSLECLKRLVRSAVDIRAGDRSGIRPVHEAAFHDQLPCLKFLLGGKAGRGTTTDNDGRNVLHKAAQGGAISTLHWLLETGMDANSPDKLGNTALHYAAARGHSESFGCLLQHGASLSVSNDVGEGPLDTARRNGKPRAIGRAVAGEQRCRQCDDKEEAERLRQSVTARMSSVQQAISRGQRILFASPQPPIGRSKAQLTHPHKPSLPPPQMAKRELPKRNLAARYYGPLP